MIGKLGKEVKALKKILIVEDDQLLNRLGFQRAAGLLIGRHTDPSSGGRTARRDKKSQRQSTALPTG